MGRWQTIVAGSRCLDRGALRPERRLLLRPRWRRSLGRGAGCTALCGVPRYSRTKQRLLVVDRINVCQWLWGFLVCGEDLACSPIVIPSPCRPYPSGTLCVPPLRHSIMRQSKSPVPGYASRQHRGSSRQKQGRARSSKRQIHAPGPNAAGRTQWSPHTPGSNTQRHGRQHLPPK